MVSKNHWALPYTLPVVVHIIHDNGAGDIPDAPGIQKPLSN